MGGLDAIALLRKRSVEVPGVLGVRIHAAVHLVEPPGHLPRHLQVWQLVLADRHQRRPERQDVRALPDRIQREPERICL